MIALLDALAGSFCQRFPFISLPFVSHMVALLDALAGAFCHRFAFISLPDGSAGAFCQRFLLYVFMCLADDCFAGCLGRIILQEFAFISFHMSSTVLMCWMPWPDDLGKVFFHFFLFVSQMTVLLDALAGSFCQRFVSISFHLSPR